MSLNKKKVTSLCSLHREKTKPRNHHAGFRIILHTDHHNRKFFYAIIIILFLPKHELSELYTIIYSTRIPLINLFIIVSIVKKTVNSCRKRPILTLCINRNKQSMSQYRTKSQIKGFTLISLPNIS